MKGLLSVLGPYTWELLIIFLCSVFQWTFSAAFVIVKNKQQFSCNSYSTALCVNFL